ncbi:hypothetical protein ACS0TY_000737 [Phlomoides rotata]
MVINAQFHLLKPSANLSKFPRASHFFTLSTSNNRGGGRKSSTIPPLGCDSEVSKLYSLQIRFKSPRASPFSTNNYSNLRLNHGGGSKFSTILPLRCNSEGSSSITESSQSVVGDPVAFRNESRTQFHATAWAYGGFRPPPSRLCGSIGGPSVEGPRIKLRDGRHLAYKTHGVPNETAKYKIVLVHGFGSSKHDAPITESELVEKLGIHFVSFDRPGYGESDPDPNRTMKSIALDIEELADQLELGPKFYVIGTSMGGQVVWGCLKYIPHRLAGATLIVPVVNYWWPGFPTDLATEAYNQQFPQDQWALRVAHHAPWLVYWWNTQKWFPGSSVAAGKPNFTAPDLQVLSKNALAPSNREYATQQGVYESHHRDLKVGFGHWDFDPMDLDNPFLNGEGSVHLWQGVDDGLVPLSLQRYIVKKLPWIQYHELPDAGHLFTNGDATIKDAILNAALLTGDK